MATAAQQLVSAGSADGVWQHCHLLPDADPDAAIHDGALVVLDGRIAWLGARAALPGEYAQLLRHDGGSYWITPGLIDCHTHLVYGGQRADEFAMRLAGANYEQIARAGGGILSTVRATRAADEETLLRQASNRLAALLAEGVTAIEIKSGYGLDLASERKQLRVARQLAQRHGVAVHTTFLGAHALPPEYAGRADDYIDLVCETMLPALADEGLVDAVDAFCEGIGFTPAQTERVFRTATRLGLPVKLHAEQLSNLGGAALAARHRALSADHLEHLDEAGVQAMAEAGTVAVLLPGAYYFLRDTHLPPIALLRQYGVPIAIATDHNPGTAPVTSLLLMLNMACTLFRMTVPEVLAAVTVNAARALGAQHLHGRLAVGRVADFALWRVQSPAELAYWFGSNPLAAVVRQGRLHAVAAPGQPEEGGR
ncbi:imidazolonepropionase [Paracidovorax citrulli]